MKKLGIIQPKAGYKLILMMILIVFSAAAAGCAKEQPASQVKPAAGGELDRVKVAVSIVPEASFVKAVGGDNVEIVTLVPPGYSPENYAPNPRLMEKLSSANLYFTIGVPSEKASILPKTASLNKELRIIDLAGQVEKVYPALEIAPGEKDPHIWLSPQRVKEMVKIIARELAAIDPPHQSVYEKNARDYIAQLDKLDEEIKNSLKDIPNRTFIVYHPAFAYFADDYNLKMVALEEEGKEASPIDLQRVIDLAKKEKIKVVFYQAELDSKQAQTLAAEIGGRTEMIAPLAPDYIENLQKTARIFQQVLKDK